MPIRETHPEATLNGEIYELQWKLTKSDLLIERLLHLGTFTTECEPNNRQTTAMINEWKMRVCGHI